MFTLTTCFRYPDSPSQKLLDEIWPMNCNSLFLRNNFEEARMQINVFFQTTAPDNIIIFSERQDIDKPVIEVNATDGKKTLSSNFNLKKLKRGLEVYQIPYEVNQVPIEGLTNDVYFYALRRDFETYSPTSIVNISLPSLKNFQNFEKFAHFMTDYINSESRMLASMFYKSWL